MGFQFQNSRMIQYLSLWLSALAFMMGVLSVHAADQRPNFLLSPWADLMGIVSAIRRVRMI